MQRKAFPERPGDTLLLDIYGYSPAAAKMTNATLKTCTCKYCGCVAHGYTKKRRLPVVLFELFIVLLYLG